MASLSGADLSRQELARGRVQAEYRRVWSLLRPQPSQRGPRRFLREGRVKQYSPRQRRVKKKYLFLFSDCLLITRRDSHKHYQMKIFCFLRAVKSIRLVGVRPKHSEWEFHLHTDKKNLILFAQSRVDAEAWIEAVEYARDGCKGPVPHSVMRYGDENDDVSPEQVSLLSRPSSSSSSSSDVDRRHQQQQQQSGAVLVRDSRHSRPAHRDRDYSDSSDSDNSLPPVENLATLLSGDAGVDFSGADSAFSVAAVQLPGQEFNPFGLPSAHSSGYQPAPVAAPTPFVSMPSSGQLPAVVHSSAASLPAAYAPPFVPDTSKGVLHTLDSFVQYLAGLPKEATSPFIFTLVAQGRESVVLLSNRFDQYRALPTLAGEQTLLEADQQCSEFGARLKAEANIASQTPNPYRQNLAAALILCALTLEQFTSQVLVQMKNVALC